MMNQKEESSVSGLFCVPSENWNTEVKAHHPCTGLPLLASCIFSFEVPYGLSDLLEPNAPSRSIWTFDQLLLLNPGSSSEEFGVVAAVGLKL